MKPTVIAGGSGENPQNHPGANGSNNNNMPPQNSNVRTNDDNNNAYANARTMPQHQTGFGYLDDDDIFSDAGLRARLNRWRDPFGFGARKRCGNEPQDDPYNRYFRDETDFFPGFGQQFEPRGRRRVTPQYDAADQDSDFFHHIPAEFRHYIPDSFGFSKFGPTPGSPRAQQAPPAQPHPQQQHYPPQYYENYPQQEQQPSPQQQPPHYQQQQSQEIQAKPVYCDASIQTDNEGPLAPGEDDQSQNLNQHGLRNTVDLGQKSPQEEERSPRAHSAPPTDPNYPNQNFASSSSQASHGPGGAEATAYAYSSDPNQQNAQAWSSSNAHPVNAQASASSHPQQRNSTSQGTSVPTPPPRQNAPQFQQQPRQQAHPQAPPQPQPQQQQQRPQPNSQQDSGTYIRHVPIFIEGRSEAPCTQNKQPAPPQRAPQQQAPPQNVPPPQQHQQQQQQHPKPQPHRPTPLDTQQPTPPEADPNQVPYTPSTTASIQKIQDIQRDVLHLMTEVEKFTGSRNDKEYMYLDEMLTRNLLKLDTIDTNGKDSIRLARREAIKCIQASINVLEAKAEGNAKTAQSTVMEVDANSPPAQGSSEDQAQIQDQQAAVETSVGETQTDARPGPPASEEPKKTEDAPAEPVVPNKENSPNLEDAQAVPISAENPTKEAAKKKIVKKLKKVEQKEKQEEAAAATESPGANSAVGSPLPETATETVAPNTKSQ